MDNIPKSTAKDVFQYLLMIVVFYIGVVSFIALLWQYTNTLFPDPLTYYYESVFEITRRSMASLIIVWPVYILMSWFISKDMGAHPAKRELWVRKWLLYLTLFISAITIIVDLINLVNDFLGGELTVRSVIKILSVLVVAVAVFGYYLWDLRRDAGKKSKLPKAVAYASSAFALAVIIAGFFIVGTPSKQRAFRFDQERIGHLQGLQSEIINYWTLKERLPESLDKLRNEISGFAPSVDPETGAPYEYTIKEKLKFELCAAFTTDSMPDSKFNKGFSEPAPVGRYYDPYGTSINYWTHSAGRTCFERTIDPEIYKPVKN